MSYILDALKKSEQERQQGRSPNLQSIHKPLLAAPSSNLLVISLVILCVLFLAVAGYFYLNNEEQPSVSNNSERPLAKPLVVKKSITKPAAAAVKKITDDNPTSNNPTVEFWELPDPIQKEIPALTFSFHVYSDNPDRRTIIINKRRVKEGDLVSSELYLTEITPEGVVLRWKNQYSFYVAVIEQW